MPQRPLILGLILATTTGHVAAALDRAGADPADLCLAAATRAAENSGVPPAVLLAVMLVETGRNGSPWPWTVNLGGEGYWLDSAEDAVALAAGAIDQGATNVDLGCFQLNHRWHGAAFPTLADMLDPNRNADYAAEYLVRQHARTGDWALAAAAYHSATPELAARYQARFEAVLAGLDPSALPQLSPEGPALGAINRFPLLVAGEPGRNGSLVPAMPGGRRLIGGG